MMCSVILRSAVAAALMALTAGAGAAHEFTAVIFAVGEGREARLAAAVRGVLLAADEFDGHSGETSDGHLGGIDVQILPLPREAATGIGGLVGQPTEPPEVVVVIGPDPAAGAALAALGAGSIALRPGRLPAGWAEETDPESFATRYRRAYGVPPGAAAAEGYNAARRLDLAIRPHDGLSAQDAISAALAASEAGIDW